MGERERGGGAEMGGERGRQRWGGGENEIERHRHLLNEQSYLLFIINVIEFDNIE